METSARRAAEQRLILDQARKAGFEMRRRNYGSTGYFGHPLAHSALSVYAVGGGADPSVTELLSCGQIPRPDAQDAGNNYTRWCNAEADRLMGLSDREVDPVRRLEMLRRIYELEASDFVSLPLFAFPDVSAWRTDKVAGPIGQYNGHPYGVFFNMNEWYVPSAPT
jgi:ABC-type transport system substrate-binding protein